MAGTFGDWPALASPSRHQASHFFAFSEAVKFKFRPGQAHYSVAGGPGAGGGIQDHESHWHEPESGAQANPGRASDGARGMSLGESQATCPRIDRPRSD